VKHENKKRRKGEGSAEVGADNHTQQILESDKNRDKKVSDSVNESKRNVNNSTNSGKRDTAKIAEPSTTMTKSEMKISGSDLNLKSVSASINRKKPQRGGNTDFSTSNVKAAHNAKRDDGRRNNEKYGTQSGSHSFNNTSGNRRGDDRRQDNRPRSPPPPPPPPPRRGHVHESRTGHGTHTRFFSPDSRDDRAMANRGSREYGGRGHGDIGRRANNSDGRGPNRRRERR